FDRPTGRGVASMTAIVGTGAGRLASWDARPLTRPARTSANGGVAFPGIGTIHSSPPRTDSAEAHPRTRVSVIAHVVGRSRGGIVTTKSRGPGSDLAKGAGVARK